MRRAVGRIFATFAGMQHTITMAAGEDLNDGDQYVFLGKDNKVLHATSRRTSLERMGKVIWDYGVRKRDMVISRF